MTQSDSGPPRSRLGFGAFTAPGDDDSTTWEARRVFLETIQDLVVEVLERLRHDVFPRYARPAELDTLAKAPASEQLQYLIKQRQIPRPSDADFDLALAQWAKHFNLEEDWVLDSAVRTIHLWGLGAVLDWVVYVPVPQASRLTREEQRFVFEHPGWYVEMLTRDEAEAQIRLIFDHCLKEYLDRLETMARERGLRKTIQKRRRGEDDPLRHFEWLVRFQVQQWTQGRIAKHYGYGDTKTIAAGIKQTAELVGLRRRSVGLDKD